MGKNEFITSRWESWEELEGILTRVKSKGIGSLNDVQLFRLSSLYRSVTADLARARAAEPFGDATLYLNHLVARTHAVIYVNRAKPIKSFLAFFLNGFPSLVREHSRVVLLSSLLFFLPAFLGYYWMAVEPESMNAMYPMLAEELRIMNSQLEEKPALLASGGISPEMMPLASNLIMVNNIRISIYDFALGLTFGIGTAYSLVMNGTMLGGVAYLYFSRTADYMIYFFAGILPHAVLEFTAIVLSGAAGFIIAGALIMPGNLKRSDALRIHGRDAVRIMYGVIIILAIAALIEAYITPIKAEDSQSLVDWLKISGSVIVAIGLMAYFRYAGRKE